MKALLTKQNLFSVVVILLISFYGIFYWQTIMTLPLFGDATIHGSNAKDLIVGGWTNVSADYPSLYSYMMAMLFLFIGETGFKFVTFIGFLFLILSTYLYVNFITKNRYLALLSILFVGSSPKIIFYSARMYQEILLSGFIIFSIFLLFKFLETKKNLLPLLLITGITLSIKQQGLFVLYSSMIIFFIIEAIRKKINSKQLALMVIVPLIIGFGFYGVLFHNKGSLMPGSDEFGPLRMINAAGRILFFYKDNHHSNTLGFKALDIPSAFASESQVSNSLENSLYFVEQKYAERAYSRAESRHIWPTDIITSPEKFNEANNLFLLTWQGSDLESPILFYFSFFFIILGILFALINYKKYSDLLLFTVVFLSINYLLFIRNNDQQRYHLFIPIFLLSFMFIFFNFLVTKIRVKKHILVLGIALLSILIFLPILSTRIKQNQWWKNSQLYSPSEGGIQSVSEVGSWIYGNSNSNSNIGQQCGNETKYYSGRTVIGDWRIYFLPPEDIKNYLKEKNIQYYVINKSQIVDDADWHHICWVPKSFNNFMQDNFPLVYSPAKRDIYVYKTL